MSIEHWRLERVGFLWIVRTSKVMISSLYTSASLKLLCTTSSVVFRFSASSIVKDEKGSVHTFSAYFKSGTLFLRALASLKLLCTTGGLVSCCSASSTVKDKKGTNSTCSACLRAVHSSYGLWLRLLLSSKSVESSMFLKRWGRSSRWSLNTMRDRCTSIH